MYNSDTELLFPLRVISTLDSLKGKEWNDLLAFVQSSQATVADQTAFVLMMVRLDGCIGCNADSFRAMKGCTQCARQNIRRHRGSDSDLVELFKTAKREVDLHFEKRSQSG